jgi:hypothetical protein
MKGTYQQTDSPLIVVLPEAVNELDLDRVTHILIKMLPGFGSVPI